MKLALDNEILNGEKFVVQDKAADNSKFPIDVFPRKIQEIIKDLEVKQNYPPEFVAGAMLFVISTALGNVYKAQLKRHEVYSGMVYIALASLAGTIKSHPLNFILQPLKARELEYQIENNQELQDLSEGEIATEAKRLLVDDITTEQLNILHNRNPKGLGLHSDELLDYFDNIDKYSKGKKTGYWLKNWGNENIPYDRVGRNEKRQIFPNYVSIIGTIQTELVPTMAGGRNLTNGYIERWLLFENKRAKYHKFNRNSVKPETSAFWFKVVKKIEALDYKDNIDKLIPYSEAALDVHEAWQHKWSDEINKDFIGNKILAKVQAKTEQYCVRIALLFEVLDWAMGNSSLMEIKASSVERSISLNEFLAKPLISLIKEVKPIEKKPNKKQILYKNLTDEFTRNEAISKGERFGISKSSVDKYLKDSDLFIPTASHGVYKKIKDAA
tara:strand:+ start:454 stop:1779 length:1326 start_codon:yes stop_codon:yes gene_type:complete